MSVHYPESTTSDTIRSSASMTVVDQKSGLAEHAQGEAQFATNGKHNRPVIPLAVTDESKVDDDSHTSSNIVTWDGPDDQSNPKNWPRKRKWLITVVCCLLTITAYAKFSYSDKYDS